MEVVVGFEVIEILESDVVVIVDSLFQDIDVVVFVSWCGLCVDCDEWCNLVVMLDVL